MIFSNRRCAVVVRFLRISSVIFRMFGTCWSNSTSQTLPINPVTPINIKCFPERLSRTDSDSTRGTSPNRTTLRPMETSGRVAVCVAPAAELACFQPRFLCSCGAESLPSVAPLAIHANGPRGLTIGFSNRPVATPSRNSSWLEINRSTPRCTASGRNTWSSDCPTRTTCAPAASVSRNFSTAPGRNFGFKT